uniref:Uncharacterized protein n=1 Tax=Arundo donax TaxID=35708 RepID=A0A0A9D9Y1_ARUDO
MVMDELESRQETKGKKRENRTCGNRDGHDRSNPNSKLLSASHPDLLIEAIARVMVEQIDAYAGAVVAAAGQDARPVHVHDAIHFEEVGGVGPGRHVRAGGGEGGRGGRRGAGRRHGRSCGCRGDRALWLGARRRLLILAVVGAGLSLRRRLGLVTASQRVRRILLLLLCQGFRGLSWAEWPVSDGVDAHLLELLLDVGVPVVLDLVVRPPGEPRRDLGPPVAKLRVEIDHQRLLLLREEAPLEVRPQVVRPPQPAALPAPKKPCKLGDEPPAAMAMGEEEGDQLLVLLGGPWPLLETDLLAARLPAHLSLSPPWMENQRDDGAR